MPPSRSAAHDARNKAFQEAFAEPFTYKASALPTAQVITEEAKKLNLKQTIEDVPNGQGARIHWLGEPSAKNVLLYFHAFPGHVRVWKECMEALNPKTDLTIAALEYGLTKEIRYPVQIVQGTEALRHILSKGYSPSNVAVGGDSGGGNLALGVVSILLHGLDGVQPLKLENPLAGIFLWSPMVTFKNESESWTANKDKDCVGPVSVDLLGPVYVDSKNLNNYSEPLRADVDWWKGVPAKSILNLYGGDECFKSHIVEVGEKLAKAGNIVEDAEIPGDVHIGWILDLQSGLEAGPMANRILEWLGKIFQ